MFNPTSLQSTAKQLRIFNNRDNFTTHAEAIRWVLIIRGQELDTTHMHDKYDPDKPGSNLVRMIQKESWKNAPISVMKGKLAAEYSWAFQKSSSTFLIVTCWLVFCSSCRMESPWEKEKDEEGGMPHKAMFFKANVSFSNTFHLRIFCEISKITPISDWHVSMLWRTSEWGLSERKWPTPKGQSPKSYT